MTNPPAEAKSSTAFMTGENLANCACPEVVAVGETAWHYQTVDVGDVCVLVPDVSSLFTEVVGDGCDAVAVTPGAGEDDDSEFHRIATRIVLATRFSSEAIFIGCGESPSRWNSPHGPRPGHGPGA